LQTVHRGCPVSAGGGPEEALSALLELMARLRDPQRGCPWDREQTFETIAPYTIEEAYEVADAVERGEPEKLCAELGDLLFQVVFHARMAHEKGWFDFAAVARGIREKLIRRHPHVFQDQTLAADVGQLSRVWEEQKAREPGRVRLGARLAGARQGAGRGARDRGGARRRGSGRRRRPSGGGARGPAFRRGQLGAAPEDRPGGGAASGEWQIRAPIPAHGSAGGGAGHAAAGAGCRAVGRALAPGKA